MFFSSPSSLSLSYSSSYIFPLEDVLFSTVIAQLNFLLLNLLFLSLSLFSFSPPFSPSLALPGPSIVTKRSIFANPVAFMAAEKVSILLSTPNHFPLQTL